MAASDDDSPGKPDREDRPDRLGVERPDRVVDRPERATADRAATDRAATDRAASDRATTDRPERNERAERNDRPEKPERTDRAERNDRAERDDALPETIRQRLESLVPELVKKTFAAGLGAVFSTEEGIRKIARESLPEVAGYLAHSADGAKDKVFEVIARETREFLSNLNLTEEIAKILTTLSFEIKTEIRFIPNSERVMGAEPDVKASVRLKRNSDDKDGKDGKDDEGVRDSRSRLRFWRRDGGAEGDEDDSHDK